MTTKYFNWRTKKEKDRHFTRRETVLISLLTNDKSDRIFNDSRHTTQLYFHGRVTITG